MTENQQPKHFHWPGKRHQPLPLKRWFKSWRYRESCKGNSEIFCNWLKQVILIALLLLVHLRKYRWFGEKRHMQTVNSSQHTVGKIFMTFTDTVQSSMWEYNFSKIWSVDILGGEKLHFPVPHLLTVLCIVTERSCTWNHISSLLKNNSKQNSNTFKEKHHFTQSAQKFPLKSMVNYKLQIKKKKTVKGITDSHKSPSGRNLFLPVILTLSRF